MFLKCNVVSWSTAFYRQNPAGFPRIYKGIFEFLINTALPASNSVYRQNFMGKNAKRNSFKIYV